MANKFSNLDEEGLIGILDGGGLSDEDLEQLVVTMEEKGLSGSIMAIEDPESEEAEATVEYIQFHKKIPQSYYDNMPTDKIKWAKDTLFSKKSAVENKKKALIILAHSGQLETYRVLEKYSENPNPELKIWINIALNECKGFLKDSILDRSSVTISKVSNVARNDPCPCGSGKKYKRFCGA